MRYLKNDACAVRVKGAGGRQLFQVVIKGDIEKAAEIAEDGRMRLLAGEELDAVKAWALVSKLAWQSAARLD